MKNKLFFHILIDICIAFSLLFLDGLRRKRKEVKNYAKSLMIHSPVSKP
jgi:hypothetical protein